jgi:hypothetical protein
MGQHLKHLDCIHISASSAYLKIIAMNQYYNLRPNKDSYKAFARVRAAIEYMDT